MPALRNQRQERFCQLLKQGMPAIRAYPAAGYKPDKRMGAPYRLSGNVRIKRRLNELTKAMAMKARVTVETITDELNAVAQGAANDAQWSAAQAAIVAKAKLHGLLIDRKETGSPGDFAGLQTREDVLALLREQLGEDAAAMLGAVLEQRETTSLTPPGNACTATNIENVEVFSSKPSELN